MHPSARHLTVELYEGRCDVPLFRFRKLDGQGLGFRKEVGSLVFLELDQFRGRCNDILSPVGLGLGFPIQVRPIVSPKPHMLSTVPARRRMGPMQENLGTMCGNGETGGGKRATKLLRVAKVGT